MLHIHQFPCLSDNYGYLLHDPASGETVAIDTPDADAYLRQAEAKGWRITQIWNTHWHPDHAGGNAAIKAATGCTVIASADEVDKTPAVDQAVRHGDSLAVGSFSAQVIDVGGHTQGHIAFHLPDAAMAFVGDALFALGCGRMFEGTAPQFWESLCRLRVLPADTQIYCAHEYTQSNARFARHADPDNAALAAYATTIDQDRAEGRATVPFPLARELATNPFLRADDPGLQTAWANRGARLGDAVATFAALREAKNAF